MPAETFPALSLARVLRPWGRRGEVAAEILTDFPERLREVGRVWLAGGRANASPREIRLISCRLTVVAAGRQRQAIIQFEGVTSIDDAEKLRGMEVQVPLSQRVALTAGRYYISDLIACEVWLYGANAPLGTVRDVQPLAELNQSAVESWVLAVQRPGAPELLIPLAAEICTEIDTASRRITIRPPDGLLDLND